MKKEVIDYLNSKAGTAYRHGTKKADTVINARIAEGATLEDLFEK
ncbi:MAG: conserved phage C-terminal domain-containing protein [Sulfurimonas sp.]|nr:conserved phage C-terminal domain-containing protein [Sulfurimonas sp.]